MKRNGLAMLKSIFILTIVCSFSVLLLGGFWIFESAAPTPERIVDENGAVISDKEQVKGGQAVFQKYGLMDYGTVLGYGSYLGPDYTAEALKIYTEGMRDYKAQELFGRRYAALDEGQKLEVGRAVEEEIKTNRYDPAEKTLTLSDAQVYGLNLVREHYRNVFTKGDGHGLPANWIEESDMPREGRQWVAEGDQITQLADFFFWTAWISSTERPGEEITYTNNFPFYEEAGNRMSYASLWWSAASVTLLILFIGVILYFFHRYRLNMEQAYKDGDFPAMTLHQSPLSVSQVKAGKYFAVVALLFLVQVGFGGLMAHYYVEPNTFYGLDSVFQLLPFSMAKTFHLQTAIFWIATAWLGMGIFIAPIVGGREPKRQGFLVDVLFWALVVLVGGSLLGEWLGANGLLGNLWFWFGHQGWEYLELGRIWQVVLAIGMGLWLFIMFRGLRLGLKREKDKGGLIHLLFYASIAVPAFYVFAFFFNPETNFTIADYWRWWIIHLWVEGIFEVFAVVVIGYLMVQMGLVTKRSTVRALYFQFILLLGSGVIGIGHHYYFNGAPEPWIALGAVFSALEVIPLTLLILEAYEQYKMMKDGGVDFPYKASFRFLVSTAVWNLVGAGVLGFLINLPAVNYFEHGTYLTTAHAHGSMMGVYGMFGIAVLLFSLRNIVKPEAWNDRLLRVSCWGLNVGLAGMIATTLVPVGMLQLKTAFTDGYWAARSFEFYEIPLVQNLLWLRLVPDVIFIAAGVLPLVYVAIKSLFHMRKATVKDGEPLEEKKGPQTKESRRLVG